MKKKGKKNEKGFGLNFPEKNTTKKGGIQTRNFENRKKREGKGDEVSSKKHRGKRREKNAVFAGQFPKRGEGGQKNPSQPVNKLENRPGVAPVINSKHGKKGGKRAKQFT